MNYSAAASVNGPAIPTALNISAGMGHAVDEEWSLAIVGVCVSGLKVGVTLMTFRLFTHLR